MNASEHLRNLKVDFGYPGLGMGHATADLGFDLIIEDLDEAATASIAPFCASRVDARPASTGRGPLHGRQALVTV